MHIASDHKDLIMGKTVVGPKMSTFKVQVVSRYFASICISSCSLQLDIEIYWIGIVQNIWLKR